MNRLLLVLVTACLLSASAFATPELTATLLRYEPAPAEQGNTVDLWVQLHNAGTQADGVVVKLAPEYPFSVPAGQAAEVMVGTIAATETKVVKFTAFVDRDAPNGPRNITFLYRHATGAWTELEAPLTLQTQDALLVIDWYGLAPSPLVPGQSATLTLVLRNTGRIALKSVDVTLGLDSTFSTVGSGSQKRIDDIGPGGNATIAFEIAADTDAAVRLHTVPVNLTYLDARNKALSSAAKIGIAVNAEPELTVLIDSMDFRKRSAPGTVSLKVVNKGVVDLKYVGLRLLPSEDFELLSPSSEVYIGNLDNDDFETVDFTIRPRVPEPRLDIEVSFKDPYNTDLRQAYALPVRIVTASELGSGGASLGTIVLVLLAAGGILWWWLRRRKKR